MAKFNIADETSGTLVKVNTNGNIQVDLEESSVMIPVDIQSRYATTIQTHNAVSVGASSWSSSSVMDCNGFDKIAITLKNDASTTSGANIDWSHDGVNTIASELILASGTPSTKAGILDVKARYAKLSINNGDAAAHTMSAWAYLKA